ncbi:hypothetical protein OC835_006493 [Tilletia horrida]|nr:hypothetical protein OC835_006493 [Tilletia horrida]
MADANVKAQAADSSANEATSTAIGATTTAARRSQRPGAGRKGKDIAAAAPTAGKRAAPVEIDEEDAPVGAKKRQGKRATQQTTQAKKPRQANTRAKAPKAPAQKETAPEIEKPNTQQPTKKTQPESETPIMFLSQGPTLLALSSDSELSEEEDAFMPVKAAITPVATFASQADGSGDGSAPPAGGETLIPIAASPTASAAGDKTLNPTAASPTASPAGDKTLIPAAASTANPASHRDGSSQQVAPAASAAGDKTLIPTAASPTASPAGDKTLIPAAASTANPASHQDGSTEETAPPEPSLPKTATIPPIGKTSKKPQWFNYVRRHPDLPSGRQNHEWICRWCSKTVFTYKEVGNLATHLVGNTHSRVGACPKYPYAPDSDDESGLDGDQKEKTDKKEKAPEKENAPEKRVTIKTLDKRVARLERKVDNPEARLDAHVAAKVEAIHKQLQAEFDAKFKELERRFGMQRNTEHAEIQDEDDVSQSSPQLRITALVPAPPPEQAKYEVETFAVKGDGHCGFRAAAVALYGESDEWRALRKLMIEQLEHSAAAHGTVLDSGDVQRLRARLEHPDDKESAESEDTWFNTTDCVLLLADLAACPVIVVNIEHPSRSYIMPPSLSTFGGAHGSVSPTLVQRMVGQVIIMVYSPLHWDYGTRIKGILPDVDVQWSQRCQKEADGDSRKSWIPRLDELRNQAIEGLQSPVRTRSSEPNAIPA